MNIYEQIKEQYNLKPAEAERVEKTVKANIQQALKKKYRKKQQPAKFTVKNIFVHLTKLSILFNIEIDPKNKSFNISYERV